MAEKIGTKLQQIGETAGKSVRKLGETASNGIQQMTEQVDFDSVLKATTSLPMVRIDREKFLKASLSKHYNEETVQSAVDFNPAYAGIPVEEINKIAKESINYETTKVSTISFVAGIPGGLAMLGTVPADLAQYFAHVFRILQKLIYLYGWEQLYDAEGQMDDKTASLLTLFTGVMFGVNGAAAAITKISESAMEHASKAIAQKALTKTTIYPIVKKVAASLGMKMTKDIFAKGVAKIIPVVGGALSGGITYATYKPMAEKLRKHLSVLKPADVNNYKGKEEFEKIDLDSFFDVEYTDADDFDTSIDDILD